MSMSRRNCTNMRIIAMLTSTARLEGGTREHGNALLGEGVGTIACATMLS